MSLIIPGVEIRVIRELVPRPLGATGILGIVGCTERDQSSMALKSLGSLQEFRETFGRASAVSMPEVRQAFAAGLNQVVVANVPSDKAATAVATHSVLVNDAPAKLEVRARAPGAWGNKVSVRVVTKPGAGDDQTVEVQVFYPDAETLVEKNAVETFRNLSPFKNNSERYFVDVVNRESDFVKIELKAVADLNARVLPEETNEKVSPRLLSGGADPSPEAYLEALTRLEAFDDVDMVTASFQHAEREATMVYAGIMAHCERMSRKARPRIGFGQTVATANGVPDMAVTKAMAAKLPSDRFVFVAPHGYVGSVIGMIAGLRYFESPTFKTLGGVSELNFDYSDPDLEALIQAGVCAVDMVPRKGIAVVKGITTAAEQINVTRVADRAVRHVQNIAQDFIGLLNTEAQRLALKQRITEAFTAMEKEGALVPSTDGKSPAFVVSVESTPADFAAGIVRVDTAVRPVRAIDYIYATIKVQAF